IAKIKHLFIGPVFGEGLGGSQCFLVIEQAYPIGRKSADAAPRATVSSSHFQKTLQPYLREKGGKMIGPVAHIGKWIAYFPFQRTVHELAEGDMRTVMIMTVTQDEIHRYIKRPFGIIGKTKIFREHERQNA